MTNSKPEPLTLSHLLYELDPMHTCCVENECFDEYNRLAAGIYERIDTGQDIVTAIHDEFRYWFDVPPSELTTDKICEFLVVNSVSG